MYPRSFSWNHEQSAVRIAERKSAGQRIMARELLVMLAHSFARPN
jgi:hypothetical protein